MYAKSEIPKLFLSVCRNKNRKFTKIHSIDTHSFNVLAEQEK